MAAGFVPAPGRAGEQKPTPDWQWFLAIAIGVVVVLGIYFAHDAWLKARADRAIDATLAACRAGSRIEFARRYVEASAAISAIGGNDAYMKHAGFSNQLLLHGCRVD